MQVRPLSIEGAFEVVPQVHGDDRGEFLEWFRDDLFRTTAGHALPLQQANLSVSRRGTLRGLHLADVPPGQAKYVTCVSGAVRDVVVDLRTGSPTFGTWEAVELDAREHRAVYLPEGLGHGFAAREDGSVVVYLCSTPYTPGAEFGIDPFDRELAIDWGLPRAEALLSDKDAAAPSLAASRDRLPTWEACRARAQQLAGGVP